MHDESHFEIRPYLTAELARMYGVSKPTFNNWLKPHLAAIGERRGRIYTALQVKIIFEKIGLPSQEAHD